ncbi:MAG: succinylglutamate desuccinylase/aspartoacylase family protein [Planctomycetota bacterium]|nr:succinylglutamate desuccinylase/aspartoacylase family protein [Planctomycetota bacterium]
MSTSSLIQSTLDYEAQGKQIGHWAVPQSTNSAGWAQYFIPAVVIRNGEGPTCVFFGGNHGDECEGPVTLMKLARQLQPEQITGRVIIVPMLNRPAVESGTRLSPIDGVNMNRAFPGRRNDTITGMIAHFVTQEILSRADIVVDIHSGGSSMHMLPSVNMHDLENREQMGKMVEAAKAWGAPIVYIYKDVAGEGLLPSLAEQMGKITLGTEMGSKSQFGPDTLRITEHGVWNVLQWAGILNEPPDTQSIGDAPQVVAGNDARDYIMSPSSGLFEPFLEIGNPVQAGQLIGQIHSTERIDREPEPVAAESSGMVMARRAIPLTKQGECLVAIVRPYAL